MNIVYVEYDLAGAKPDALECGPIKRESLWMPYYGGAKQRSGKLDPETGVAKEYDIPNERRVAIISALPGRGRHSESWRNLG